MRLDHIRQTFREDINIINYDFNHLIRRQIDGPPGKSPQIGVGMNILFLPFGLLARIDGDRHLLIGFIPLQTVGSVDILVIRNITIGKGFPTTKFTKGTGTKIGFGPPIVLMTRRCTKNPVIRLPVWFFVSTKKAEPTTSLGEFSGFNCELDASDVFLGPAKPQLEARIAITSLRHLKD